MPYNDETRRLKLEAEQKYKLYVKEKQRLEFMVVQKTGGIDQQTTKINQARLAWAGAHMAFEEALAEDEWPQTGVGGL